MKKQLTILLIFAFVSSFIPINVTKAITQNQINAEVQIVCTDGNDNWFSGSGTMIDPKGIILTNRHVVEDAYQNICFIGFVRSINQEPDFGTQGNYNLAEVKYKTTTSDMDVAILYLDNPNNTSYPYVDIWNSNSDTLKFGDKIEVIGFPSIGNSTITYTEGVFGGLFDNYIKTNAPLEHGNSGGGAFTASGQFIGIPTYVIKGELNSLSYILSINSIKKWLQGILGSNYTNIIEQNKSSNNLKTSPVQTDLTPPDIFKIKLYEIEFDYDLQRRREYWGKDQYSPERVYAYDDPKFLFSLEDFGRTSPDTKIIYMYFGTDINAEPATGYGEGYFYWDYNKDLGWIFYESINHGKLAKPDTYYLILQAVDQNDNYSEKIRWRYIYDPSIQSDSVLPDIFQIYISEGYESNLIASIERSDEVQTINIPSRNIFIKWLYTHDYPENNIISYEVKLFNEEEDYDEDIVTTQNYIEFKGFNKGKELKEDSNYLFNFIVKAVDYKKEITPFKVKLSSAQLEIDNALSNRLKGKLLLQVEDRGRIWYVNPDDATRHEVTFVNALPLFQKFALGITNNDLNKIPLPDDNWTSQIGNRLKGKLLLQVEEAGRIWYVDFDGKKHEVTWDNLMSLFENLALGVTNENLYKIPVGILNNN